MLPIDFTLLSSAHGSTVKVLMNKRSESKEIVNYSFFDLSQTNGKRVKYDHVLVTRYPDYNAAKNPLIQANEESISIKVINRKPFNLKVDLIIYFLDKASCRFAIDLFAFAFWASFVASSMASV